MENMLDILLIANLFDLLSIDFRLEKIIILNSNISFKVNSYISSTMQLFLLFSFSLSIDPLLLSVSPSDQNSGMEIESKEREKGRER